MIALQILDIKKFMSAFLIGSLFDEYALIEAQITTFCTFSIDGRLERAFYEAGTGEDSPFPDAPAPAVEYVKWQQVRERCFSVIRGRRTPVSFRFIFYYPRERIPSLLSRGNSQADPDKITGLCLNLRYDGEHLLLTTGTALKIFTTDRSADRVWDGAVRQLLADQGILVSEL